MELHSLIFNFPLLWCVDSNKRPRTLSSSTDQPLMIIIVLEININEITVGLTLQSDHLSNDFSVQTVRNISTVRPGFVSVSTDVGLAQTAIIFYHRKGGPGANPCSQWTKWGATWTVYQSITGPHKKTFHTHGQFRGSNKLTPNLHGCLDWGTGKLPTDQWANQWSRELPASCKGWLHFMRPIKDT